LRLPFLSSEKNSSLGYCLLCMHLAASLTHWAAVKIGVSKVSTKNAHFTAFTVFGMGGAKWWNEKYTTSVE